MLWLLAPHTTDFTALSLLSLDCGLCGEGVVSDKAKTSRSPGCGGSVKVVLSPPFAPEHADFLYEILKVHGLVGEARTAPETS